MIANNNFILEEIPKFHAISQQYDRMAFWKEQKRRCIEGYWFGGKWMPGTLYYYCNFHTIRFEEEGSASRRIGRPWLRDIEWEKAYLYTEACGFSGFEKDKEYTCDRRYGPDQAINLRYGWITPEELAKVAIQDALYALREILIYAEYGNHRMCKSEAEDAIEKLRLHGFEYQAPEAVEHHFNDENRLTVVVNEDTK